MATTATKDDNGRYGNNGDLKGAKKVASKGMKTKVTKKIKSKTGLLLNGREEKVAKKDKKVRRYA